MEKINHLKKIVLYTLVVSCFSVFLFHTASAATIEDLTKNIEQKNEEIKKLEEEARKYRDSIVTNVERGKTLKQELARIDGEIKKLRNDIAITERKIQKTKLEIETIGLEIREKESGIKKLQGGLASVLQSFAEKGADSLLEILIKHSFLSDFFGQLDTIKSLQQKMLDSIQTLKKLKGELAIKKASAEEKHAELKELNDSLGDRKSITESIRKERDQLLKETKNQEKQYQELLRDAEKRQEAMLREIEEMEEALRKLIDPDSLPPRRPGLLLWPVQGRMSQGYGETPFTQGYGRHFYKFHNGIDIVGAIGTPIRSADDGKIIAVGDTDRYCRRGAYGKYIVIDHLNNLATMYAHLSLIRVSPGQEIKKGDIIGYVGNTGLSTGPHLHFTLYDTRTVELRLGPTGTCGILPFGGSLNPLLYL